MLFLLCTRWPPAICVKSYCELSQGQHAQVCLDKYLQVCLLDTAWEEPSQNNQLWLYQLSLKFNITPFFSLPFNTARPASTLTFLWYNLGNLDLFYFANPSNLYSFLCKCQGNRADTYRKCQQRSQTKDMEFYSCDKPYLFLYFLFPCRGEPCGSASFSIKGQNGQQVSANWDRLRVGTLKALQNEAPGQLGFNGNTPAVTRDCWHTHSQEHACTYRNACMHACRVGL